MSFEPSEKFKLSFLWFQYVHTFCCQMRKTKHGPNSHKRFQTRLGVVTKRDLKMHVKIDHQMMLQRYVCSRLFMLQHCTILSTYT